MLILKTNDFSIFDQPIMLFIYLTVSLVVGWLASRYYEKPAQVFLRKRYERRKGRMFSITPDKQKTVTHAA